MSDIIVAYSERLGPVTDIERRLESQAGAVIKRVSLWNPQQIAENCVGAQVVIVGSVEPFTSEALTLLDDTLLIVRRGVGTDNIDVDAASKLGIAVAYVPDASVEEVSDHALALLFSLERRVVRLDRSVRGMVWERDASSMTVERAGIRRVSTLTLGILGLGRIGASLARKATPLFGRIIGHDPQPSQAARDAHVQLVSFVDLLDRSDLISLHAPLTPATHHMIDRPALLRMKPGAYLVNTSRGGLIDEAALVDCLTTGHLAGAGLDVTQDEPLPADSPLLTAPNLVLTGHSAASSSTASEELRTKAVEAALSALRGDQPVALANPDVLTQENSRLRTEGLRL